MSTIYPIYAVAQHHTKTIASTSSILVSCLLCSDFLFTRIFLKQCTTFQTSTPWNSKKTTRRTSRSSLSVSQQGLDASKHVNVTVPDILSFLRNTNTHLNSERLRQFESWKTLFLWIRQPFFQCHLNFGPTLVCDINRCEGSHHNHLTVSHT